MTFAKAVRKLPRMLVFGELSYDFDSMPLHARKLSFGKRINLLLNGLNILLRRTVNLGLPPVIQVEPSSLCNLNCPLCPTGSKSLPRPGKNMELEIFEKLLAELSGSLVAVNLFSFGEPFMNRNLTRMIKACTDRNILTVTSTNGHFIQSLPEAIEVVQAGLSALIIAVDGSTQEIYEKYRRGGNLARVIRCIKFIEEAKSKLGSSTPYTNMRTVVTRENQEDLENLKKMADDLGVNMFSCKSVGCLPDKMEFSNFAPTRMEYKRFASEGKPARNTRPFSCMFPFRQPTVFSDGTVVGCEFDHELELPFGGVGEKPFAEIWNNINSYQLRESVRKMEGRPDFCRKCPYEGRVQNSCVLHCLELKEVR